MHNAKIINGIGNLIAEVGGLHSQLSITTNERNVLVETVKNLNKEIRNLKSELINQQSFPDLRDKRDEPISKLEEKHVQDTEPLQDNENQEQDDKHYDNVYNSQEDLPLNIVGQSQHVMSIKRIIVDKAKEVAEGIEARYRIQNIRRSLYQGMKMIPKMQKTLYMVRSKTTRVSFVTSKPTTGIT